MIQPSASASPIKEPERSGIQRIEKYVPGIGLIRTYKRDLLKTDIVAAATVFAILVPSALAYGELAGFEPVVGLYAALVGMIAYALLGSSLPSLHLWQEETSPVMHPWRRLWLSSLASSVFSRANSGWGL
jgi:hypothetical protein